MRYTRYTATREDMVKAKKTGLAARKVGGYTELVRLSNKYARMKKDGKTVKISCINGKWDVREIT